jgi:hypothetical protein
MARDRSAEQWSTEARGCDPSASLCLAIVARRDPNCFTKRHRQVLVVAEAGAVSDHGERQVRFGQQLFHALDPQPQDFLVRRAAEDARPYPLVVPPFDPVPGGGQAINAALVSAVGKTDYAANGGSVVVMWGSGPDSLADALAGIGFTSTTSCNGIAHQRSKVRFADISDGTSATYLVGEKYLDPRFYTTGASFGDDHSVLVGDDVDLHRWTVEIAEHDRAGLNFTNKFGSAHSGVWYAALCDGSVRGISYTLDAAIHKNLGSRGDGQALDEF